MGKERSVGGDHDNDRAHIGRNGRSHSRARTTARGAARHEVRNLLTDGCAGDAEVAASPVIALHQYAHRVPAILRLEPARRRPDPSLELVADHSRAPAYTALDDGTAAGTVHRGPGILFGDVKTVDVVEPAVPRL